MRIVMFTMGVILFAAGSHAGGAEFHVAVTGSDASGNGSQGNPWATITHALDNASDGAMILVGPGTYNGRVRLRGEFANGVTVRAEPLYQARLRNNAVVVTSYYGQGITLEGFDIAHSGPGAGGLVVQIQDLRGEPGGLDFVQRITIRNNILHDSYNNDILKINNGAANILVEGNVFYNQQGSDEHIDVNSVQDVTIQDNIFFNDFAGSGRVNNNDTSGYIVIKDSNGNDDTNLGSEDIIVRRNVFLNWEGSTGSNFVLCGEDGNNYYEAVRVTIENNLFLGNSANVMRAPFGVKGCSDIFFINNTITGDLPSLAYAMRLNQEGANLPNNNIVMANNIWSDPTGTMGSSGSGSNDFSDTPIGETASFTLDSNCYWNGGAAIPMDENELVNVDDDINALIVDPELPLLNGVVMPRWDPQTNQFGGGFATIRQAFVNLVQNYGTPAPTSMVQDAGRADLGPMDDILGEPRDLMPDLGAVEINLTPIDADVDDNGVVDAVDIQLVINAALGLPVDVDTDINGDTETDAVDVQLVINAALAGLKNHDAQR
jgi:hypothetical protein